MGESTSTPGIGHGIGHYLPEVILATILVVLGPAVIVWQLASTGTIDEFLPLVAIGLVVSMTISLTGSTIWKSRKGSTDLLFSDLMLWGWLRRWRAERRLDSALTLLDLSSTVTRAQLDPDVRIDVLKGLASSLESRDPYTHGHSRRVARYAAMIAEKMELPDEQVNRVRTAAAVHDVGKLEIPLDVLNKPGRLTDEEFDLIKTHAPIGADMVRKLGDGELTEMVAHHHERLDGTGYPSKLGGAEIPIGARIIAVADTFDALTSTRAYRPAKRHREALGILHAEAGTQLDPLVVEAFDRCYAGSLGGILVWPLLAGLPHRLWSPFESQISAASGTAVSKAFTVVATTAATGSIAVSAAADPRDTNTKEPTLPTSAAVERVERVFADSGVAGDPAGPTGASSAAGHDVGSSGAGVVRALSHLLRPSDGLVRPAASPSAHHPAHSQNPSKTSNPPANAPTGGPAEEPEFDDPGNSGSEPQHPVHPAHPEHPEDPGNSGSEPALPAPPGASGSSGIHLPGAPAAISSTRPAAG